MRASFCGVGREDGVMEEDLGLSAKYALPDLDVNRKLLEDPGESAVQVTTRCAARVIDTKPFESLVGGGKDNQP